ncbi:MAG: hypothetical protein Fur0022_32080 [Anaerolineales bacterium]
MFKGFKVDRGVSLHPSVYFSIVQMVLSISKDYTGDKTLSRARFRYKKINTNSQFEIQAPDWI